ncbi:MULTISPECIES: hypothetical protein [Pseudomonas]|uniref:hypothetical protein n=1 Tax=Pseudomonas TaxID=286 RepID=UPI0015534F2B|nr:hypothetical protein [Pseudomonas tumuqii]
MSTKYLMKKLPSCLLGAILAAGIASSAVVNAVDGIGDNDLNLFELEGNTLVDGAGPATDWDDLHSGVTPDNMITFTGVLPDPAPQTIFWKGGSKDVSDVSEWWYKQGSVSDKSNITNAYAAAFSAPADVCVTSVSDNTVVDCATAGSVPLHEEGDLIVYFGMDRFANSGDTFGGFWFFQNPDVGVPNPGGQGPFAGSHVAATADDPGDVLVLVEYPQASGSTPEIKVYEWDPNQVRGPNIAPNLHLVYSASQAECDSTDNLGKLACAKVNLVTLDNPPWDYTPKGGNADSDMPTQTFFEGGINLTGILGSTPCISAFLAETRSSRSETASLEDFAFGGFDACGASVSKSCESEISDNGDTVTVTFYGEVSNTGLPLDIELEDLVFETGGPDDEGTPGLTTFTKVCVDTNDNLRCDVEANIASFTPGGIGDKAIFSLDGGQTVVYEGYYELTSFTEETPFTDKVIMSFFDPGTGQLIATEEAISVECPPTGDPSILVTKTCAASVIDGGSLIQRIIEGTVLNDGNVKLEDVTLSDTVLDTAGFEVVVDVNENGFVDPGETAFELGVDDLQPGVQLAYKFTFDNEELNHSNIITASGSNVFDDVTVDDDAEVTGCSPTFVQGLQITKACDPADAGVSLKLVNGVLVVEVSNVIEVENVGEGGVGEALTVTVSDDQVDQLVWVDEGGPAFDCLAGNSCTGTLKFGESAKFEQSYRPDLGLAEGASLPLNDSSLIFSNTATAEGVGVLSGNSADTETDTAECPLCPAPSN